MLSLLLDTKLKLAMLYCCHIFIAFWPRSMHVLLFAA